MSLSPDLRTQPRLPRLRGWAVGVVWAAAVAAGFVCLWSYEATPGSRHAAPAHWPAASRIQPDSARCNLVLAVHPRCPCSRASLQELAEIMARCPDRLRAHGLVYRPATAPAGWERGASWDQAAAIPGVTLWTDVDGVEARLFGAATSGHVVLFGVTGERLFSGGITGTRGHTGDNAGRRAVLALATGSAAPPETEVFGCPLHEQDKPDRERGEMCPDCQP